MRSDSWFRLGYTALLAVATANVAFPAEKFKAVAHAPVAQQVEFDVLLPLTHRAELDQLLEAQHSPWSSSYHQWLTPEAFRERFGPDKASLAKVASSLQGYGLTIARTRSHGLRVRGSIGNVESMLSTSLWLATGKQGQKKLMANSDLSLPGSLAESGARILEFSPVIRNHVHSKQVVEVSPSLTVPANRYGPRGGYWFTDIKQAYDFPSYESLTGKGVTIGILMSSDFSDADLTAYFAHEKLAPPKVVRRQVLGGAAFDPVNNAGASFEVSLDLQQAGGMAPDAGLTLYNIPDLSDASVAAGYLDIVEANEVDIVSSSFGGPEAVYFPEYNGGQDFTGILQVYDELFKQGNAQGITFVASSGDSGALGKPPLAYLTTAPTTPPSVTGYFLPGVEEPAASTYVTAVGGTNLVTTYNPTGQIYDSTYVRENAYGDPEMPYDPFGLGNLIAGGYWGSGGGVSEYYMKPSYQKLVKTGSAHFRTVPDISMEMGGCPGGLSYLPCGPDRSYVITAVGGKLYGLIGTSVSSPEFAGLLAIREQFIPGRMGNVNYYIYQQAQKQFSGAATYPSFHEGIPGFNGYYTTKKFYDLVLGNGTVDAKYFIGGPQLPSAGIPQTPSNP